jgi:hypothetical protein
MSFLVVIYSKILWKCVEVFSTLCVAYFYGTTFSNAPRTCCLIMKKTLVGVFLFSIVCYNNFLLRVSRIDSSYIHDTLATNNQGNEISVNGAVAASCLRLTYSCAGLAAVAATTRKEQKCSEITSSYILSPLASKTFGSTN